MTDLGTKLGQEIKADRTRLTTIEADLATLSSIDPYTKSEVDTALSGKANTTHTHAISDVTNLQTTLDGKANESHAHAISSVIGLQTALNGKASLTGTETLTNKTIESSIITNGYTEEVFTITGTTPNISPNNGSIQTWVLTANSTPTLGTWDAGQSITLMIDDGSAYSINWTNLSVAWKTNGGVAPTLNTSGYTVVTLWKVGSVIYGARVGDA